MNESLDRLERLADAAPDDIRPTLARLIDAFSDTVRVVAGIDAGDGTAPPIDVASLQNTLDQLDEPMSEFADYAQTNCQIDLS